MNDIEKYNILGTDDEAMFDRISKLSAQVCETPFAFISLQDSNRPWFKSRHGPEVPELLQRIRDHTSDNQATSE